MNTQHNVPNSKMIIALCLNYKSRKYLMFYEYILIFLIVINISNYVVCACVIVYKVYADCILSTIEKAYLIL